MSSQACPDCGGPLEKRSVTPCVGCGGELDEVDHHLTGLHGYAEYEVFDGMRIVLCNYCALDFPTRDPADFGLPSDPPLEREDLRLRARLERPEIEEDGYCPSCGKRLAFLRFMEEARQKHAPQS